MDASSEQKGDKKNLQHPTNGTVHGQGTPWRLFGPACGAKKTSFLSQINITISKTGILIQKKLSPKFVETERKINCKNCLKIFERSCFYKIKQRGFIC